MRLCDWRGPQSPQSLCNLAIQRAGRTAGLLLGPLPQHPRAGGGRFSREGRELSAAISREGDGAIDGKKGGSIHRGSACGKRGQGRPAQRLASDPGKRYGQAKITSGQVGPNFDERRSNQIVADEAGESVKQVQRFIRLNKLTPELMKMVDDGKLKTTPAVELSYLTPEEQEDFLSYMESEGCTPSLSQAQKLKEASKESVLTSEKIQHIMAAKPPSVKPRDPQLMIPVAKVERYFPKGFTSDQMQQVIVKLLENYARAHQHGSR